MARQNTTPRRKGTGTAAGRSVHDVLPPLDSFAPDEGLSIERTARYLGVTTYYLARIPAEELPRMRIGARCTYRAHDIRTFIERVLECGDVAGTDR